MLGCKNFALAGLAIGPPRSVATFVKYREVLTRTILPNFIDLSAETAFYLRFGGAYRSEINFCQRGWKLVMHMAVALNTLHGVLCLKDSRN